MELRIESLVRLPDLRAADELLREVWGAPCGEPPMALDIMRALAYTGGYVAGAYDGDVLVGVAAGFRAAEGGLHSHITGVAPGRHGQGIGLALKRHQRTWAADRELEDITWTFDPLIRRNAYFNLAKLRAVAEGYLPDFYGAMTDGINDGDASDRLFVRWTLGPPEPPEPLEEVKRADLLTEDLVASSFTGEPMRCATPADIEGLRKTDPVLARAWRAALRDSLGTALAAGYRVTGFTRDGWYLLDPLEIS
ncbi:GNAT family N-acetyltransferase [Streptosporangium roseum]|uniref:GNAT family N-acetyltransferase n=1 Tax=Streptosporangium roseum TaxID=2001 RepID=UPI0018CBF4A2|nr:GNAT family N-acetyltransferase [Streptosporangium roseum]